MDEKKIIASTYYDLMDVYRKTAVKDPITKITKLDYVKIQSDLSCALSKKSLANVKMIDNKNDILYMPVIFLDPSIEILPGDKIIVTIGANNSSKILYAGEPMVYISHQEIACTLQERS